MICDDLHSLAYVTDDELAISGLSVHRLRLPVWGPLFKLECPATLTQYSTLTPLSCLKGYADFSAHYLLKTPPPSTLQGLQHGSILTVHTVY